MTSTGTSDPTTGLTDGTSDLGDLDDAALVARYQQGDRDAAFGEFLRRHGAVVRAICAECTRDQDAAKDLVQEVLTRFVGVLPSFEGGGVRAWLRTTAHNACLDHARRARNRELALTPGATATLSSREDVADAVVTRHAVHEALGRLRPVDAALLRDHHLQDRPLAQMARTWSSTEKSLSVRLTRARQSLRTVAHGLRGLVPVGLLPRLWRPRSAEPQAASVTVATAAIVAAELAVVVIMLSPGNPHAGAEWAPDAARPTAAAGVQIPSPERLPAAVTDTTSATDTTAATSAAAPTAATTSPAADGAHTVTRGPAGVGEAVKVPGSDVVVHGDEHPEPPDYSYEVRAGSDDAEVDAAVEVRDEPRLDPVNAPACEALQSSPGVVGCRDGSDDSTKD